jgi:ribonuclease P protein component
MAPFSLKRIRLKRKEFKEVLKDGKVFKNDGLVMKVIFKEGEKKIGFLISKKISKKAVVRNKLKRRLRELLREKFGNLKEGLRIVFIPLPSLEKKNFKELKEVLEKVLIRSKVLKNEHNFRNL